MKFLTISNMTDARATLQPDEKKKLNIADIEYIYNLKKKMGDKLSFYSAAGWGRAVSIGEYDSIEEYYMTLQAPSNSAGYSHMESYALVELDEKALKTYLKQAKAAK